MLLFKLKPPHLVQVSNIGFITVHGLNEGHIAPPFGTNVGLNMLLSISSRYFGGLIWSRQLRGLPSSDGYFSSFYAKSALALIMAWCLSGEWTNLLSMPYSFNELIH